MPSSENDRAAHVRRTAYDACPDRRTRSDVAQEEALREFTHASDGEPHSDAYIRKSARHTAIDIARREGAKHRGGGHTRRALTDDILDPSCAYSPVDEAAFRDLVDVLKKGLSPEYFAAIEMRCHGMTRKEMAAELSCGTKEVANLLTRLRRRVRRLFEDRLYDRLYDVLR